MHVFSKIWILKINVLDDVGGIDGYVKYLKGINQKAKGVADTDWSDDYGGLSPEVAKKYEKTNDKMLKLFKKSLTGLTEKTISNHLDNADFYINDYLLYRCGYSFEQGITEINEFLGYFFIRKCTWSTPGNIKTTAASIKKFYKCMMENGKIGNDDYTYLCDTIKAGMKEWQDTCAQYNDEDYDDPFEY